MLAAACVIVLTSVRAVRAQQGGLELTPTAASIAALAAGDEAAPASADFSLDHLFRSAQPEYTGGRGLITPEGITGMFINPTSGTLPKGTVTAQYCAAYLGINGPGEILYHTGMLAYGVTDWLEVGGFVHVRDPERHAAGGGPGPGPSSADLNDPFWSGGGFVRARLIKDEEWWPETSVGFITRNGDETLNRHTLFIAASKYFAIDPDGVVKGVRLHGGFRRFWQDDDATTGDGSIFYGGGELELPYDVWFVGEISSRDSVFPHTPHAFGIQWRPNPWFGISLAGVQTEGFDHLGIYAGLGISFEY
ncbi:MAG: hypothetical protein GC159_18410 [Phycisphaera sp.]|nr:hypothetical protein [Phycisphaera sp.]